MYHASQDKTKTEAETEAGFFPSEEAASSGEGSLARTSLAAGGDARGGGLVGGRGLFPREIGVVAEFPASL